jgi:hypothetical protein
MRVAYDRWFFKRIESGYVDEVMAVTLGKYQPLPLESKMKIKCPYTQLACLTPYRCEFDRHCRQHAMVDVVHPLMFHPSEPDTMVSALMPVDAPEVPPPFQGGGTFGGAGATGGFEISSPLPMAEPDPAPPSGGSFNPDN